MINCIIIDDEPSALKGLTYELKNFEDQITIKAQFTSAINAIDYLRKNEIDAVFLDVEMPEMNGLSFLKNFQERNFYVIFTTAYSKYAINAIKEDALDYLLKPVDMDDLESTIKKIEKNLSKKKQEDFLEIALDRLNQSGSQAKRIKISYEGKIHFLNPNNIIYCESDGNYCYIHIENGNKMFLSQKLKQLEDVLPKDLFYRIHNSYMVNLQKIISYNKNEGYVELTNNIQIPVSRQKRGEILDKI